MRIIITFFILSVINVIFSTARSIITIKSSKGIAAIVNAGYFAFYNVVMIYTLADFALPIKCAITFVCNLIGVYVVKLIEEKARKDKLWLVKVTVPHDNFELMKYDLERNSIPYSYIDIEKYVVFDTYCETQRQTELVIGMAKTWEGKCFATENKL